MATFSSTHCRSPATTPPSSSSRPRLSPPCCWHHRRVTLSSIPSSAHSLRRSRCANAVRAQEGAGATTIIPIENELPLKKSKDSLSLTVPEVENINISKNESTVSITVVGASGDLAKKKIFPALFALFCEDRLPKHFTIYGYARSKMTDADLRKMISKSLTCRIDKSENCEEKMDQFLKRYFYHSGHYHSVENFAELDKKLKLH